MLQILILTALCFEAHADITLKECLNEEKKYGDEALGCDDVESEKVCKKLFGEAVKKDTDDERPDNCWKGDSSSGGSGSGSGSSGGQDDEIVKAAAKICPKTCGLCCKTSAFACNDDPNFDCPSVRKKDQCKDPWKSQLNLVDKCPKTCGLCDEKGGDCQDKEPNCDETQCKNTDFVAAMRVNCKKTCNFCDEETTTASDASSPAGETSAKADEKTTAPAAPTSTPNCGSDPRCKKWIANGFCKNNLYPDEYKMKYCGKECGKC